MRCLVTGVAGFVGSHLAERLLAEGHDVCGVDAFIDYYPRFMKEKNLSGLRSWPKFTFVEGNLLELDLPSLLDGVEWVFHQAAQAGVRASWGREFTRYADCNVLATQRLLEELLHSPTLKRFVYASSSSVYGNTTALPIHETTLTLPVSPYGVTKLAAEHLCSLYYQNFGIPTVSLRYFTVYGPRQRPDMAFHKFCKAAQEGRDIHVFGDGLQTRDFTYISDIVQANLQAARSPQAAGEVLNIAGGSRVTVRHVLDLLQEINGSPIHVTYEEKQHGDVEHTYADTTRAQKILGYHPQVALREGLHREFDYIASLYKNTTESIQVA